MTYRITESEKERLGQIILDLKGRGMKVNESELVRTLTLEGINPILVPGTPAYERLLTDLQQRVEAQRTREHEGN